MIGVDPTEVHLPLQVTCPNYRVCGPACPLTCQNYGSAQIENCTRDDQCYEGCFCMAGYVYERESLLSSTPTPVS